MPVTITPKLARHMWANRLESGTVAQATGILRDGDRRCCLGVACDLSVDLGVIEVYPHYDVDLYRMKAVQRLFGLQTPDGYYDDHRSLVQDNDIYRRSFGEIAATIRSEPEGLFHA